MNEKLMIKHNPENSPYFQLIKKISSAVDDSPHYRANHGFYSNYDTLYDEFLRKSERFFTDIVQIKSYNDVVHSEFRNLDGSMVKITHLPHTHVYKKGEYNNVIEKIFKNFRQYSVFKEPFYDKALFILIVAHCIENFESVFNDPSIYQTLKKTSLASHSDFKKNFYQMESLPNSFPNNFNKNVKFTNTLEENRFVFIDAIKTILNSKQAFSLAPLISINNLYGMNFNLFSYAHGLSEYEIDKLFQITNFANQAYNKNQHNLPVFFTIENILLQNLKIKDATSLKYVQVLNDLLSVPQAIKNIEYEIEKLKSIPLYKNHKCHINIQACKHLTNETKEIFENKITMCDNFINHPNNMNDEISAQLLSFSSSLKNLNIDLFDNPYALKIFLFSYSNHLKDYFDHPDNKDILRKFATSWLKGDLNNHIEKQLSTSLGKPVVLSEHSDYLKKPLSIINEAMDAQAKVIRETDLFEMLSQNEDNAKKITSRSKI